MSSQSLRGPKNCMLLSPLHIPKKEISVQLPFKQLIKQEKQTRSIRRKRFRIESQTLSQTAVEIKSLMAFRKKELINQWRIHSYGKVILIQLLAQEVFTLFLTGRL